MRALRKSETAFRAAIRMGALGVLTFLPFQLVQAQAPQAAPDLWQVDQTSALGVEGAPAREIPRYIVNAAQMDDILRAAPLEDLQFPHPNPGIITLPLPDGSFELFRVEESPIMAPGLAMRYPSIRNYKVAGVNRPELRGRLDRNDGGIFALLLTPEGPVQINPSGGHPYYVSVYETASDEPFECGADDPGLAFHVQPMAGPAQVAAAKSLTAKALASGSELRVYRLAVSTTAEYYSARGNTNASVLASINTVISRVNTIYEAEVAIRFVLIDETDQLFSQDTNDFTNAAPATMREENQVFTDGILDDGDYDIGHVFGTSPGGGNAAGSVVCIDANKARGASGLNIANDPATENGFGGYRLVMHEIAHQFSAGHTWSGALNSCSAGQFSATSAYEPLSGTTIMAYPGTCGDDNITGGPVDEYFHTHSFDQIVNYSVNGNGNSCAQVLNTGNSAPVVNAGPNFTIPANTPFTLTGSADDPDGDPLTYTWEQYDLAPGRLSPLADTGDNPLFRSFPPGSSPSRTFPQLGDVLSGVSSIGEILPQGDRTMTFRLTARDNRADGGGVDYDTMTVNVAGDPFFLTSPNGGETLNAGCTDTATWTVGGGNVAPNVNLLLSTDGGLTFPEMLEAGVPNNGSASFGVPCMAATNIARMRAEGVGNIFFDISDGNFAIAANPPAVELDGPPLPEGEVDENCEYVMEFSATVTDQCSVSENDISVEFSVFNDFAQISNGTFETNQVNATTVTVTGSALVSDLTTSPVIARALITAADGCNVQTQQPYDVTLFDNIPPTIDVTVSPNRLWPPNHSMRTIIADVVVQDNCPISSFQLLSVTSNEPDNGTGDGNFPNDIQDVEEGTPDTTFRVRAERMGGGQGRIYTATYQAEDGSGNTTDGSATITVPLSQRP
jgi:hypothetical protein